MIPRALRAVAAWLEKLLHGGRAAPPAAPRAFAPDRDVLAAVIENTRTHLAYLDPDFNFVLVNQAYVEGSGHGREELLGRNHFGFFPNAENQAIFERVQYVDQPWRGTTYWDWTLTPVKDEAGRVKGLVLSLSDVTGRTRAKQQLERAYRKVADLNRELAVRLAELRRLQRAKAEYLQVLAHELRNPLSAALGLLQLSRRRAARAGGDGDLDCMRLAEKELKRLEKLVEEIITAHRVTNGRLPLALEPIDLVEVVKQGAAPYLKGVHKTDLLIEEPPAREIPVRGDADRLAQVVTNLLSNSVKYSPAGSPIRLRLVIEADHVLVQVEDQGIGIPPDQIERVFEGFYRGSNLPNLHPGGIGLGLYISRDIARRHGGDLWATNRPGGGTVMHLRLPLLRGGAFVEGGQLVEGEPSEAGIDNEALREMFSEKEVVS